MAAPPDDDMLRDAARARGFRLVKSRRRKPGGDFGRYGLVGLDSGRECLGFGGGGLTATADEVLAYLRGGEVASWKRSLIGVVGEGPPVASTCPERSRRTPANATPAEEVAAARPPGKKQLPTQSIRHPRATGDLPSSRAQKDNKGGRLDPRDRGNDDGTDAPPPQPGLTVREATRRDAAALATLVGIPAATLAERLATSIRSDEPPLVADRGGAVGLIAWTIAPTLQHGPRARITLLVVAEGELRRGIGTRLLAEAEQRLQDAGIDSVELSLDIDFDAPTAFLRRTGFTRAANGFAKTLGK